MKNNDININISQKDEESKASFISKVGGQVVSTIAEAKWKKIAKVYFVTFFFIATAIALLFVYNIAKDKEILSVAKEKVLKERNEENIRDYVVTPKIQHELEKLVYVIKADRAFLFELHNGKRNTSGLPFRFADMSYEEVNEENTNDKVAMRFQNIPLTLYKYPHYLQKEKIFVGSVQEVGEIDFDFANHIKEIGGKYLGMIYINNNGIPLAFLCVSYHSLDDVPLKNVIENKLKEYAKTIGQYLDLQVQLEKQDNGHDEDF